MGPHRIRPAAGLAIAAVVLTASTAPVAAAAAADRGVTVQVTGGYRHTFHLASCQVSPPQKGNPTVTWGMVAHLSGDQDIFGLTQGRSNTPVGHIDLRTTNSYQASFVHGDTEWQAGFLHPGHQGSGTATVGRHVASGSLTATLTAPNTGKAPIHVTATWHCAG